MVMEKWEYETIVIYITGKYRGSAHSDCNLKRRISAKNFKLPVIFHNLHGYDSHFKMQEIGSTGKSNNLFRYKLHS